MQNKMSVGLFIGVPFEGRPVQPEWAMAFANMHPPMNMNTQYMTVKGDPVDLARNKIANAALANNAKYLYFLGDDTTPPPHTLRQLIYRMEHMPEVGVMGGIYCIKQEIPQPLVFRGNGASCYWDWKVGEVFEVTGLGMDCTIIRVDMLREMVSKGLVEKKVLLDRNNMQFEMFEFFKTVDDVSLFMEGINKTQLWTEDLYFCHIAIEAGWKVYADGGLLCGHWDQAGRCYTLPKDSKPFRDALGIKFGKKKIVDLGAGPNPLQTDEGKVLTVDIRDECKPDYRCDLRFLPFANEEFDIVFSSHTLEHFSRAEMPQVLNEWVRILKPEGEFRMVVPNVGWAAQQIASGKMFDPQLNEHILNVLYGSQEYKENFHKVAFTPEVVEKLLKERGFKRIEITLDFYNIFCRAWRSKERPKGTKQILWNIAPGQKHVAKTVNVKGKKKAKPIKVAKMIAKAKIRLDEDVATGATYVRKTKKKQAVV